MLRQYLSPRIFGSSITQLRTLTTTRNLRKAPEDRTGPEGANVKGEGKAYDPKKLTDGISEIEGKGPGEGEASPTKEPTRSTGIKQESKGDSEKHR